MIRRIISGFGANAFGQTVSIVIQLFSLPLFLYYWDTSTYGAWLILSAVPAYLTMADVGMVNAAGNKMTMALGRSDTAEAEPGFPKRARVHDRRDRLAGASRDAPDAAEPIAMVRFAR